MIADVENGRKSPTLRTLYMLARGLACSVSDLLGFVPAERITVTRSGEYQLFQDPAGVERRLLSPAMATRGLQVLQFRIPPGATVGMFPPEPPTVLKHVTVVEGRLEIILDTQSWVLEPGDSIAWTADVPHGGRNLSDAWTTLLHVVHYGTTASPRSDGTQTAEQA